VLADQKNRDCKFLWASNIVAHMDEWMDGKRYRHGLWAFNILQGYLTPWVTAVKRESSELYPFFRNKNEIIYLCLEFYSFYSFQKIFPGDLKENFEIVASNLGVSSNLGMWTKKVLNLEGDFWYIL